MSLFSEIRDSLYDPVIVAAYADPPCVGYEDWTTIPDDWSSAAVDRLRKRDLGFYGFVTPEDSIKVLDSAWDEVGGPVVLLQMSLKDVLKIDYNNTWVGARPEVSYRLTSLCAHVEYHQSLRKIETRNQPVSWLMRSTHVTGFDAISHGSGCNPAGEVIIPGATLFNRRMRAYRVKDLNNSNDRDELAAFRKAPKLTTARVKRLFPNQSFALNRKLEDWTKRARPGNGDWVMHRHPRSKQAKLQELRAHFGIAPHPGWCVQQDSNGEYIATRIGSTSGSYRTS